MASFDISAIMIGTILIPPCRTAFS